MCAKIETIWISDLCHKNFIFVWVLHGCPLNFKLFTLANLPYSCYTLPPTQQHSFFRNLAPLSKNFSSLLPIVVVFSSLLLYCHGLDRAFETSVSKLKVEGQCSTNDSIRIQFESGLSILATRQAKHFIENHPFMCLFLVILVVLGFLPFLVLLAFVLGSFLSISFCATIY